MKKLMIAAAIVCVAALSQAATWNWGVGGTSANQVLWDNGSAKNLYATTPAATVYLFDAGVVSQDTLLSYLRAKDTNKITDKTSVASTTINSSSKLVALNTTAGAITYGSSGNDYDFYMAVLDAEGNLFLSSTTTIGAQDSAAANISFTGVKAATQKSWTDDATFAFAGEGGKGAGWYAVPEPTSGLLMLIGMAGLALRRRRA